MHYDSFTQGTWEWFSGSTYMGGMFWNNSNTQNDEVLYKIFLDAGTYTFDVIGLTAPEYGIMTLLFGGVSQGTIDWYAAGGTTYNVKKSIAGIVVAASGLVDLSIKIATRNGSATQWYLGVQSMALYRTA
jgi:hypothetical protein